jgi:WD40 repeat protein
MNFFSLHLRRSRFVLRNSTLVVAALALAAPLAFAQGTHLWTQSRLEEFEKGTPQGVALTSDGHLTEGPSLSDVATTPSTYVWSVATGQEGGSLPTSVDWLGFIVVGTASPATVLGFGENGFTKTYFESKDVAVQVVRLGPDGALYAATLPSGKVYKLNPEAKAKQDESNATVVFDAAAFDESASKDKTDKKSHYIWEMTFDKAGRLYIATGGPGAIYRVDVNKQGARPELFFKSDEEHIRSLAWDAKGNLIAGSDGSGLVYRISPDGKGYVLFEAPRREITSLAVSENGTIYAASVGDKSRNPLPPLPVQGAASMTMMIVQPGSMQAANTSASVPEGSEIYAIAEGKAPRKLWSGKDEIVYALAAEHGGILALTGNRGRVFSIRDDGSYEDIAHLGAQQGLSLASVHDEKDGDVFFIGTGNTGKIYSLERIGHKHEYASDVLDAGAMARFGRVEVEPGSANYELLTRSGNVEQPVRGWTDWQPLKDGAVASTAGRYLQWKAVLSEHGRLGSVGVNYLPVNAAPVVDDLVVATGARWNPQINPPQPPTVNINFPSAGQNAGISLDGGAAAPLPAAKDRTAITVRWAAHDDNGDDLSYALYLRGDGETVWRLLKNDITDKATSFDAALIPDGGYQVKVVASDAPSHTFADALSGEKVSERFEVDTTPPIISGLHAALADCLHQDCHPERAQRVEGSATSLVHVTFDAEDAFSPIARAEYSLDAGPWKYIEPVGSLSDARREHYDVQIPVQAEAKASEHLVAVRVYDRYENVGVAKTVIPVNAK